MSEPDVNEPSSVKGPPEYVVAHLHEALTHDSRLGEQSIEVLLCGERVVLRGELATLDRCAQAIEIAKAHLPGYEVVADLRVCSDRVVSAPEEV
jgi:hypothetical protein